MGIPPARVVRGRLKRFFENEKRGRTSVRPLVFLARNSDSMLGVFVVEPIRGYL